MASRLAGRVRSTASTIGQLVCPMNPRAASDPTSRAYAADPAVGRRELYALIPRVSVTPSRCGGEGYLREAHEAIADGLQLRHKGADDLIGGVVALPRVLVGSAVVHEHESCARALHGG